MKPQILVARILTSVLILAVILPTSVPLADPILKPKKYHGPIPAMSLSLAVGFLAGPDNEPMNNFLDELVNQASGESNTKDFGNSLAVEAFFTNKMHPNFAFRAKGGAAFLSSDSKGFFVGQDTSVVQPLFNYDRKFEVLLFSIEASGLVYFQDASVNNFQTYMGGGFSIFIPRADFEETRINDSTGQPAESLAKTKWSLEPGVHGVLGFLYHVRTTFAVHMEGRVQIAQSKFSLDLPTATAGVQPLSFDVDYSGFTLAIGVARFF